MFLGSTSCAAKEDIADRQRNLVSNRRSLRTMILVGAGALAFWGIFNLYPQLQATENSGFGDYPADKLWTYGSGITEGTQAKYNVYHAILDKNVTVSYIVLDTDQANGMWKVAVEVTDGQMKESAYAFTAQSILPVSGSDFVGELDKFAVATKMPVADFLNGLHDQPLVIGGKWQMAFLAPDNTYTRSNIVKAEKMNGEEVFVLKYGPEKVPSFAWIAKNYPIPLKDEYKDPLSGEIISVHELLEYKQPN